MKAYVLEGINKLIYKDIDVPKLREGYVLVEVKAAGICGSDIPRIFTTGTYHFPTIPGHEFAGVVVDVYDTKDKVWIGKRVGVFPMIPCQKCGCCREKEYEMCSNYNYLGSRCDGGFAEYVAVPVWNLIELPDGVSFAEAAMLEPASVALHAVRRLDLEGVSSVALFGLGTIGIIIAQWLHINGIQTVIATGHNDKHGDVMKAVASEDYIYIDANGMSESAGEWILDITGGIGVDAVLDCVATSDSLKDALECVKSGGQIVVVGNPKDDVSLDKNTYWKILRKQIRLTGTWNSSFTHDMNDDWHEAIKACARENLHLKELITHQLFFDDLHHGLDVMRNKSEYRNKVMICRE